MTLAYLTIAAARSRLIQSGQYDDESVPSNLDLELLLTLIESLMDEWFQWRPALTAYRELTRTNERGVAFLTYTPAVLILSVKAAPLVHPGFASFPNDPLTVYSTWLTDNRLELGIPNVPVEIEYFAGHDPLPATFALITYQVLIKALKATGTSGDLDFLGSPYQQTTSISLPGGLSKSFSKGGGGSSEEEATVLSQMLKPLNSYQRRFILSQGTCTVLPDRVFPTP